MKNHSRIVALAFALVGLALAAPGFASPIFVVNGDIGSPGSPNYTGTTPLVADTHTTWNAVMIPTTTHTFTSSSLLESDGTTDSGITLMLTGPGASTALGTFNVGGGGVPAAQSDLMRDYVDNNESQGTESFSFNNLPAGTYDLYLYSENGTFQSAETKFTIGSDSETATNSNTDTAFVQNHNYVVYSHLVVNTGSISGTIADLNGNYSSFNGFQLVQTAVPEPASLGLLVLGGAVLLRRRRA